jgi:hypothetical protein
VFRSSRLWHHGFEVAPSSLLCFLIRKLLEMVVWVKQDISGGAIHNLHISSRAGELKPCSPRPPGPPSSFVISAILLPRLPRLVHRCLGCLGRFAAACGCLGRFAAACGCLRTPPLTSFALVGVVVFFVVICITLNLSPQRHQLLLW